ncbi:ABC transporter permease [Oleiharenicola lentus]|uniref:ABC transporter permease n=1 Tax=Oleiharenicola lentus TaxID=2508720 RepID=UPI003F6617F2
MNTFLQDLKFSLRLLAKTPGFALAAIIVLALGIGLNTAMFSVVHALAFSPRPFSAPERVVQLYTQSERDRAEFLAFSFPAYRELRERRDIFSGVLAHNMTMIGIGEGAEARRSFSALVSSNYFEVLGVSLLRGRPFTAEEEKPGANLPVVIASHLYWKKAGFPADFVGSAIRVNERAFTVVGITPENFSGTMMLAGPELYFPLGVFGSLSNDFEGQAQRALEKPDSFNLFLVGRLQSGITTASADAALAGVADSLEQLYPVEHKEQNFLVGALPRLGTNTNPSDEGVVKTLGLILLGMTAAVLLIVCLNLAGMLLARGHARRKEFAIRLALGGGRARIVRQLLTEGFLLSLAGGILGFVLALWSADLLVGAMSFRIPIAIFFGGATQGAVLVATFAFCALATCFFALGPALKLSRCDLLTDLKGNAGEDVVEKRRRWLPRHPLVVTQIALSLALLIAAGLFVQMSRKLIAFESGYHAEDTLIVEVDASLAGHDETRSRQLYVAIEHRLAALPGVQSASIGAIALFGMINLHRSVRRAGVNPAPETKPTTAAEGRTFTARWNAVGGDYFATMGLPVLRGRAFSPAETIAADGASKVVMIDEVLAQKLWPDGDALGQHLQWSGEDARKAVPAADAANGGSTTLEIVGIVRSTRDDVGQKKAGNSIYVPFAQGFMSNVHFHVRPATLGEPAALALIDAVRRTLRETAPGVPVFTLRTFRQHRDGSLELWSLRLAGTLFLVFGGLATLVAVVGLYGVKTYAVSRRTREIGIRLALGAEPRRVRNLILREGIAITALGTAIGLLLGAGLGQLLASVFVNLPAFDLAAFVTAATALFATAILACWLPAVRATRVSPMTALRTE